MTYLGYKVKYSDCLIDFKRYCELGLYDNQFIVRAAKCCSQSVLYSPPLANNLMLTLLDKGLRKTTSTNLPAYADDFLPFSDKVSRAGERVLSSISKILTHA